MTYYEEAMRNLKKAIISKGFDCIFCNSKLLFKNKKHVRFWLAPMDEFSSIFILRTCNGVTAALLPFRDRWTVFPYLKLSSEIKKLFVKKDYTNIEELADFVISLVSR